ncbi:uncharacterized protein AB675_4060 [Cyphellophora attinorum]|uniref:F-box domain-containing protein n=1 Tax=Cyphellophora attinorum TaxID=1664694 RepID=A0A0N1HGF6_9EURO|nr:uncharacterized protein AB675_4060 [Phialophora attinorum]KPI34485.1 hypothetical protein AB675_4060 [Phialophora attinorum]
MSDTTDLEQFRQAWREEVNAKARKTEIKPGSPSVPSKARLTSTAKSNLLTANLPARHPVADVKDDSDFDSGPESTSNKLTEKLDRLQLDDADQDEFTAQSDKAPETALEHFERAVQKEGQGNLGDSLTHYRKAYKLDAKVDQKYKEKHYSHRWKQTNPNPSNASPTVPNPAHHSSDAAGEVLSTQQLIESFAGIPIEGAPPVIERDVPPPCPIQKLPAELLVYMLQVVGSKDPALLARLAPVCKSLAYHIFTENSIWKHIALGSNFGFKSQQHNFVTDVQGRDLIYSTIAGEDNPSQYATLSEHDFPRDVDWRDVFQQHPRIRFSGAISQQ